MAFREGNPISSESRGRSRSFSGNAEHVPARPQRVVSLTKAGSEVGYPARPAVRSVQESSGRLADAQAVGSFAQRHSAETSKVNEGGCLRPIDPNEMIPHGLWEWLMDYKPMTYGQYDAMKKNGLPRPRNNNKNSK